MKHQGIGKKLVEFCEKEAKRLGYQEIYLWTFKETYLLEGFMNIWDII